MIIPLLHSEVALEFEGAIYDHSPYVVFGVENFVNESPSAVALAIEPACKGLVLGICQSQTKLAAIHVKNGPNDVGPSATLASSQAGGQSGTATHANTAYLAEKSTAIGGRQGRGRMYIPGVTDSAAAADGIITPANITVFNDVLDDFLTALDTAGHAMVLLHSNALAPTPVTELAIDPKLATQRRRMRS